MKKPRSGRKKRFQLIAAVALLVIAVITAVSLFRSGLWNGWQVGRPPENSQTVSPLASQSSRTTATGDSSHLPRRGSVKRSPAPSPIPQTAEQKWKNSWTTAAAQAAERVKSMSLEEKVGQTIMAPLQAGYSASSMRTLIERQHVGSVLIIGNWNGGKPQLKPQVDALQNFALQSGGSRLIIATDNEGGLVQHVRGPGFERMPSALYQGKMSDDQLRLSAARWGSQLKAAGVNVDLAPVLGTVQVQRSANAPIGALNRDFGLGPAGTASHGSAFVQGMKSSGVQTAIKHFPGLGAVTGNTDFTARGTVDTTTRLDSKETQPFIAVLKDHPAMVMMSLAQYRQIDPGIPAVFSPKIIRQYLRQKQGYQGIVISDSLSAGAISGYPVNQLGVKLIEAGGDMACIGAPSYVQPIISGLLARARSDTSFSDLMTQAVVRIMTVKIMMGLAGRID